jgi:hypothetical protein
MVLALSLIPPKTLPVTLPLSSQPAQIMTLKDRTPNAIARLFVDELRAFTQPLRKDAALATKVKDARERTRRSIERSK